VNQDREQAGRWSTSSFGGAPDTTPKELAALGEHMNRCDGQRGALFALKCTGDAVNGFAAPRLITTLVLFATIGVIVSLLA
jgi:hypothetical protein